RGFEREELFGNAIEIFFQPACHCLFFAKDLFADTRGFGIAETTCRGDQNLVARDLHLLECVARKDALHHFIACEDAAEALPEAHELRAISLSADESVPLRWRHSR